VDEKPVSATGRTVVIADDDLLLREGIASAEAVAALVANEHKDR
jgi:hypothetical protein